MENSITNRQMVFIIFLTITTYTTIDLPKVVAETAGRSSWIPIIISSIIFGVAIVIITKLNYMFQGKMIFDYSRVIVGKFFTYLISIFYLLYFFIVAVFLKLKLIGLLTSNFIPNTPPAAKLLLGITLFAYVAYKGITNIARGFEILGITFLIVTVGICVLLLIEGNRYNILPFFNANETKKFMETMKDMIVPFGGIEVLLIIPFTAKNKKAPKIAFLSILIIGFFYVLLVEGTLMILGVNNTIALNDSFIEAIKVVEIPVLERTDVFYLTFGLTNLFAGMIIVFSAILELACKLFSKVKRHIITIIIGVSLFIVSLLGLKIKDFNEVFHSIASYLIIVTCMLVPSTLFIIAKVKKRSIAGKAAVK